MITGKTEQDQKFISVYRAHVDEVYQFIYLRTGLNQTVAEDVTQDIFTEVYKGLSGFRGLSSERTWVFRIARNRLNDFYRQQYRPAFESVSMDDGLAEQFEDTGQDVQKMQINAFEQEAVRACLSALPQQYKIILTLKYMDEKASRRLHCLPGSRPRRLKAFCTAQKMLSS